MWITNRLAFEREMIKTKWSNFHATVNFNKDDASLIYPMRDAVDDMVASPFLWWWLKKMEDGSQKNFPEDEKLDVARVRVRAAFEHGGAKNHGLHVHILIEVEHSTMVQISKEGMAQFFRSRVGFNPNIHVRFVKGEGEDKDYLLHYLTKEVPRERPESALNSRLRSAFRGTNEEVEAENLAP